MIRSWWNGRRNAPKGYATVLLFPSAILNGPKVPLDKRISNFNISSFCTLHLTVLLSINMTKSFNIIACGAGLGGLGASIALARKGHKVTVLEATSQLNEVGAGIQIPPNSSRILKSYGLEETVSKQIVWPSYIYFRRYCTGDVVGPTPLRPTMIEKYGYP
jgi:hypothetical protein